MLPLLPLGPRFEPNDLPAMEPPGPRFEENDRLVMLLLGPPFEGNDLLVTVLLGPRFEGIVVKEPVANVSLLGRGEGRQDEFAFASLEPLLLTLVS